MFVSNRLNLKSKAAFGLLVTVFVATACSHSNLKDSIPEAQDTPEVSADQELPAPEPVAANESGTFEETKSGVGEVAPAPVFANEPDANPYAAQAPIAGKSMKHRKSKNGKVAKHKASKKSAHRRHKKMKKVAKNHKVKKQKKLEMAQGTAMGSVNQLPPPPPEMMPPPPPPPPAQFDSAQAQMPTMNQADDSSGGNGWMYVVIASVVGLIGLGIRYRGKFAKKSRRLIYAK